MPEESPATESSAGSTSAVEKITVSSDEIAATDSSIGGPARLEPKLPPAIPWWAKAALSPLVFVLPILCLVAITLRVAMRGIQPRLRHAWTGLLTTLLIISGLLTSAAMVVALSFSSLPLIVPAGLAELDERAQFPTLPSGESMSPREVSGNLKSLVAVISPARRLWFSGQDGPSNSFGAGTLLQANADGYLFVTARHVVDDLKWTSRKSKRAFIAMSSGTWGGADIIARHKDLDMGLLWMPRHSGRADFTQPVETSHVIEGATIFVIGHPEGLRFTLSTGIISRIDGNLLQISAPISPGNSGGPVFDEHGNLVGIVTSVIDKQISPNAENLNFAVRASALLRDSGWEFSDGGQHRLAGYLMNYPNRQLPTQEVRHP